ncbi:DUF4231 domain-containing protein [Pendulispora brunnea]|uniref:DUF4231 domain-containing protein n=1 Tax=Pendulispora brunnea TaxID=2905690 RepID=A0ABZ2K422_9BACT
MNSLDELLTLAAQGKWIVVGAIVIGAIVRLLKSDTPLPTVPSQWRPWLALGLGAVAGILQAVAAGTPWQKALIDGLVSALTAIAGHDLLIESLRGGREIGSDRAPVPAPPSLRENVS